ncbi:hypothetical protein EXIGLDRAFT_769495 [Exidia glandulosa HHB12029]|uniref:Uncharacterized protein n=1 Tax=Exidia glandulosa HHB12029 TaxID=1314781 RepID=A0A165HFY4_EXIGL|nr:hypothetical protein EXIGLDRAFT_769495 [Exidia glandulosa HHB12029]
MAITPLMSLDALYRALRADFSHWHEYEDDESLYRSLTEQGLDLRERERPITEFKNAMQRYLDVLEAILRLARFAMELSATRLSEATGHSKMQRRLEDEQLRNLVEDAAHAESILTELLTRFGEDIYSLYDSFTYEALLWQQSLIHVSRAQSAAE